MMLSRLLISDLLVYQDHNPAFTKFELVKKPKFEK
jgi:hypothetical protein